MLVTDREPIVVCYNVVRKVLSRGLGDSEVRSCRRSLIGR